MRKQSSIAKKSADQLHSAEEKLIADLQATLSELSGQAGKNPAAVALGRLGGLKGGPARAKKLTKAQRSEIARKAAHARWGNV